MSSQQIRQSEIFAGEDWTVLYRAFTQINFNAYDPASINAALRAYLIEFYPEDYNDWVDSSEFVAILDLLSWLAGSLAFRTDVNARENFLETANAKESVLRLARFLSYNPRRAQSSRGLVKLVEVKTTQSVVDGFGVDLNGRSIVWNDPDNIDWFEQFVMVLNSALVSTNQFGIPLRTEALGDSATQLYRLNSVNNPSCVYAYSAMVEGESDSFELVNVNISSDGFTERPPITTNPFHLVYRNDGKGNDSERTGFFCFFKQGALSSKTFYLGSPVENRVIDLDVTNVNQTDVWVQSIDDDGNVTSEWTKVPGIFNQNVTFNDIAVDTRDIFTVISRDADRISLRFGDGRFGNVPVGNIRVWYRTCNGLMYTIRPKDMENITTTVEYQDTNGLRQELTLKFSLQESVSNSLKSEDIEQIRRRAPQVYGTQNRMVSGEDYNVFPLSSNEVVKLRAVNRVYSGHSRYVDINDPTATLQDTVVFSNDGYLYRENVKHFSQVPLSANLTADEIVSEKIAVMISSTSVRDLMLEETANLAPEFMVGNVGFEPVTATTFSSAGTITWTVAENQYMERYLSKGAKLLVNWDSVSGVQSAWVQVLTETSGLSSQQSQVTIDEMVGTGAWISRIIPTFRNTLDARAVGRVDVATGSGYQVYDAIVGKSEIGLIREFIEFRKPFNLYYVNTAGLETESGAYLQGAWIALDASTADPADAIKVLSANFVGGTFWDFRVEAGSRYVFESVSDVRFHDLTNHKVLDGTTGADVRDNIRMVWGNKATHEDVVFDIVGNLFDRDGYPDTRKVVVTPTDSDDDGNVDYPLAFSSVVGPNDFVVLKKDVSDPFESYIPAPEVPVFQNIVNNVHQIQNMSDASVFFVYEGATRGFYKIDKNVVNDGFVALSPDQTDYVARNGVGNVRYEWKHYAGTDVRIDPAITNIIDVFVLTSEYDYQIRQWISNGGSSADEPQAPTPHELGITFAEFNNYKMFSDELIWRPVKYKFLFGSTAQAELQAQFKIVKLPNSALSDGEIRTKVIESINSYFDVNKWEFGETFYFTELAAYIHLQLAAAISSVVIVPLNSSSAFGNLFEVRCGTDEMFISTAQVSDVVIIDSNSTANLRINA